MQKIIDTNRVGRDISLLTAIVAESHTCLKNVSNPSQDHLKVRHLISLETRRNLCWINGLQTNVPRHSVTPIFRSTLAVQGRKNAKSYYKYINVSPPGPCGQGPGQCP